MATSTMSALVMALCIVLGMLVVSTQGQIAMAPTPVALVPGIAPSSGMAPSAGMGPSAGIAPSAGYNPTGAPNYISYTALSADRAPCPSGVGRSYYQPSCTAQPSATPYARGCYQITRCARG